MTKQARDRPLVTFALFAYNQEEYIREAVEGAFAQTYAPLEIILSDDCSSDRTFEIMRGMAAAYAGPHSVRAVKTKRNLGVTPHVLLRGCEARGDVIVVAAGDDISKKERCSKHVQFYDDPNVMAVSGAYDLINAENEIVKLCVSEPIARHALERQRKMFHALSFPYVVIQGSTASYRKSVFSFPIPKIDIIFSEDNLFNFLIYANGYRVAATTDSLVKYREHPKALGNKGKIKYTTLEREVLANSAARKDAQKTMVFKWVSEKMGAESNVNNFEIEQRAQSASIVLQWPETGYLHRSLSLLSSLVLGQFQFAKWKSARLFGKFPRYQPKNLVSNLRKR